jgi:two-component system, NarL family, response regulator NreC
MAKIRVFITDDHAVFRDGIRMLINAQPDMEVVGEAGDVRTGLAKASEVSPDLLTLDLSMPGSNSVTLIERLRLECPRTRVLVLTMHDDVTFLRAALAAGAAGYVVKTSASGALLSALRAVHQGGTYVDAHMSEGLFQSPPGGKATRATVAPGTANPLSPRELKVLEWLAQGYTNQQVAEKLFVSTKTVEAHRARICHKLGLRTRADLVRYAMEIGLLSAVGPENPPKPRED